MHNFIMQQNAKNVIWIFIITLIRVSDTVFQNDFIGINTSDRQFSSIEVV